MKNIGRMCRVLLEMAQGFMSDDWTFVFHVRWLKICVSCHVIDDLCFISGDLSFVLYVRWLKVCALCQVIDGLCFMSGDLWFMFHVRRLKVCVLCQVNLRFVFHVRQLKVCVSCQVIEGLCFMSGDWRFVFLWGSKCRKRRLWSQCSLIKWVPRIWSKVCQCCTHHITIDGHMFTRNID